MPWDYWLIFLCLAVLIPWRGRKRLKRLLSEPPAGTAAKLRLYGATMAWQWVAFGVVAWRASARGMTAVQLGLAEGFSGPVAAVTLVGTIFLAAFQWFNLRRLGRMNGAVPEFMRKLASRILPTDAVEFPPYAALAVTAGVCEEFLYRGFVMAALGTAGVRTFLVVILSALLFGWAHAYQGRSGMMGTTLLGVLFAAARLAYNSLLPVIVWHAVVDLVAGVAGPRYLRPPSELT